MMTATDGMARGDDRVLNVVGEVWGWPSLRPGQGEAIEAALCHRDSLLVMPTGGGKSLCYQVPPLIAGGLALVVSPLIALMKDQVDALRAAGVVAGALHADQDAQEQYDLLDAAMDGTLRLLYVTPERLVHPSFLGRLGALNPGWIAVDEAHCISQWGHDFRPEYRRLAEVRRIVPEASLHACTATATERVRDDIVNQLGLHDPLVFVGAFDRPNLTYRVTPRSDVKRQVCEVLSRHRGNAGIVYCGTRKQTETLAKTLQQVGWSAKAYHAGLDRQERARVQEAFSAERIDVVVATVAFGMGIDRSDVRCIVHASMPDSLERYQQETGRAGRDDLPAECVLLYSGGDAVRWHQLHEQSSPEDRDPDRRKMVEAMQSFCGAAVCRRHQLARHFGHATPTAPCKACDVCLGEIETMRGGDIAAKKILSAVARTGQLYGIGYVVEVLRGTGLDRAISRGHADLSVFGLLKDMSKPEVTHLAWQLVHQNLLKRVGDEYPVLHLTQAGVEVMRGERDVSLTSPPRKPIRGAAGEAASWEGVDKGLYEHLRLLRRSLATEKGVPAYVIFGDATLRELAARKPETPGALLEIKGIGEKKLDIWGGIFLEAIAIWQQGTESTLD